MRKLLKNKKGSALATTVLVVAVVIILTSALLTVVTYALRQSYKSSMRQQAYFTARSAALKFRDYLQGENLDGTDEDGNPTSLVYTGLQQGWTAQVTVQKLVGDEVDSTFGNATVRLEKVSGKKWKIVSTATFPAIESGETNTAVVYFIDDYTREPIKANNRNMIVASAIDDEYKGAPQYFTSSTFISIEKFMNKNRGQITKADYNAYIIANPDIQDHMTHVYSKDGTALDLQSSYYSGYMISEQSFTLKGVGATCYGIRCLGDFNIPAGGGSNLYVYGDVYVGGNITIDSNTNLHVFGNVYCGGDAVLDNIYVHGDIYVCGTENDDGTVTGGKLSARDGFLPLLEGNSYYVSYDRLGGNTHMGNYNDYMASGRAHQVTYADLAAARETLKLKLDEDVYGKAAYVEVLADKTNYLEELPEVAWYSGDNAFVITQSGYLSDETIASMKALGNGKSLLIDASKGEVDIYLTPGSSIGRLSGGGRPDGIRMDASEYAFGEIGIYGDYAVRLYMGENTKFYVRNTKVAKVDSLAAGRRFVYPRVRENDDTYTQPDPADEPNFYILSDRNGADVRIDYTNFVGYIIMPNKTTRQYQRDAQGKIMTNDQGENIYTECTGVNNTSKIYANVGQGSKFYGSIFADNFSFLDAGDQNSRFYFIPPTETKFMANLAGWIRITDPKGDEDGLGGGMSATPFTASQLYLHGASMNATKSGAMTHDERNYGKTTYYRLEQNK